MASDRPPSFDSQFSPGSEIAQNVAARNRSQADTSPAQGAWPANNACCVAAASETQSNTNQDYSIDIQYNPTSDGVTTSFYHQPSPIASNRQWNQGQVQDFGLNQLNHSVGVGYPSNTSIQHTLLPSVPHSEAVVSPSYVSQQQGGSYHNYINAPGYSISHPGNQYQSNPLDLLLHGGHRISNLPYVQNYELPQLASPAENPAVQGLASTQRRASDFWQNPSLSPLTIQTGYLQIPTSPIFRTRSAPDCDSTRSARPLLRDNNTYRRRSLSRPAGSRQSSCAPTLDGDHTSQAESTLEANQCFTCKKILQDDRGLKRHQKTHSKDFALTHKCDECDAAFQFGKDLVRHTLKHNDKPEARKYKCPGRPCEYATKGFKRRDHFKRHLKRQHGMVPTPYLEQYD